MASEKFMKHLSENSASPGSNRTPVTVSISFEMDDGEEINYAFPDTLSFYHQSEEEGTGTSADVSFDGAKNKNLVRLIDSLPKLRLALEHWAAEKATRD
jgi:hypothetical protein